MTATSIMILGESGFGKTFSLRNLKKEEALLIQAIDKKLPFKGGAQWTVFNKESNPTGNRIITDNADVICSILKSTKRKIVIIDDVQFIMSNRLMNKHEQMRGNGVFEEYRGIARDIFLIMQAANSMPDDAIVFFLWHTDIDDEGKVIAKTVGKQTEKINTPQGFFPIVLRAEVRVEGERRDYLFRTQTDGRDPTKSPPEMFDYLIPNDLALVVEKVKAFYGEG